MRPASNTNSSNVVKAPVKAEKGPVVRLPVKKMYCAECQRLVKGQKQVSGSITRIICPRCTRQLRVWNGLVWRSAATGSGTSA